MNQFSATTESVAVVAAPRADIWTVLTDPVVLPKLTPLLKRIETDGDLWRWYLTEIKALGVSISPKFTERMLFRQLERIDYSHEPPAGVVERAWADGWYVLADHPEGSILSIRLTLTVELPLPRSASRAVRKVMQRTMARTGDRFSENLHKHLNITTPAKVLG